jgi:hypothetical protein
MRLDVALALGRRHTSDVTIAHRRGDDWLTAGVIDGWGSWGRGMEAADRCRGSLDARWGVATDLRTEQMLEDIHAAVSDLPDEWVSDDMGCAFSIALALVRRRTIHVVAAGAYGIVQAEQDRSAYLFRPRRWIDTAAAEAGMTAEQMAAHPLHRVVTGPWVADKGRSVPSALGPFRLAPGAMLVIADVDLLERHGSTLQPGTSAQAIQDLDPTRKMPVVSLHA